MKSRKLGDAVLLKFDREEEVISTLTSFILENNIPAGVFSGIGAVKNLTIGYFDLESKSYRKKSIPEMVEVISITGNVSYLDGRPFIHAHISVADQSHRLFGGHLFAADVAVTLEMYLRIFSDKLVRSLDPEIGFNFWDL